jgi:hypothetical protein
VLRAVSDEVADQKTTAKGKTTWLAGQCEVSHTGDPARGRWSIKRAAPKPAAKAKRRAMVRTKAR